MAKKLSVIGTTEPRYFLHQLRVLVDRLGDRHEDHADLLQLRLEGRRHRDGIEHGVDGDAARHRAIAVSVAVLADAGEDLLLLQRDAEPRVGLQDLRIDLVEARERVALRRGVVVEVLVVDLRIVDARPGRLLHADPAPVGLQPPLGHPLRLVLLGRDEADDVLVQSLRREVGLDVGREAVFVLVDVERPDLRDRLLNSRHQTLLKSSSSRAALAHAGVD